MNLTGFDNEQTGSGNNSRQDGLQEIRRVEELSQQRKLPDIEKGRRDSIATDGYDQTKKGFGGGYER